MNSHVPAALDALVSSADAASERVFGTQPVFHRRGTARLSMRSILKNTILANPSLQDLLAIGKFLEPIVLRERMVSQEPRKRPDHIYFVELGLASLKFVSAERGMSRVLLNFCRGRRLSR